MENIIKIIAEIEVKVAKMKASLQLSDKKNISLSNELEQLQTKLEQRESELIDFKKKYDVLSQQLENQQSSKTKILMDKDDQIDELVREIDDCINRLRS